MKDIHKETIEKHEQRRVAVGPGNAQFISIRQVSSDAATLRRCTCGTVVLSAAAADKTYCSSGRTKKCPQCEQCEQCVCPLMTIECALKLVGRSSAHIDLFASWVV